MATQKNKKGLGGSWGLLGIAVLIGIGAFYLTNKYLVNKEAALRDLLLGKDTSVMVKVVVATTNLVPGDAVGPENMAVVELLGEHVSQFAVTPGIFGDFQGHVLERPMSKGEPLLAHFMAGRVIARFSELVEVGERAVTIGIDEFATDSYMLTAGDFVDIFLLMDLPKPQVLGSAAGGGSSGTEKILMPLLQKIKVIALGPRSLRSKEQGFIHPSVNSDDDGYGAVTVAVRVMDAAKLEMARVTGEFVFMLRNSEDKENKSIKAINESILVSLGLNNSTTNFYEYYAASRVASGSLVPLHQQIGSAIIQSSQDREFTKSMPLAQESREVVPEAGGVDETGAELEANQ